MKCHQCENPAFFLVENQQVPLCLACYERYAAIMQVQTENYERELNYLSDQIAGSFGLPPIGPRYPPRPAPTHIGEVKLNNIKVTGGVVGAINTGNVRTLDVTIGTIKNNGDTDVAEAVSRLSEAIIAETSLDQDEKNELVEILGGIAHEAATPPEHRHNSVAKALLVRFQALITGVASLATIWQQWGSTITGVFGG